MTNKVHNGCRGVHFSFGTLQLRSGYRSDTTPDDPCNPDDPMPDQTSSRPDTRINRRDVLAMALVAQAPAIATIAGAEAGHAAIEHEVSSPAKHREPRYRETAHIRAYYDRSRF